MKSRRRISGHRRRCQKGSALVEGALVFPIFFLLIIGVMDCARMIWSYNLISNAAREATRYAIVHGSASGSQASVSDIQGIVASDCPGLDPTMLTTTVTFTPNQSPASNVTVTVTYTYYPIASFISVGSVKFSSTSQLMIYQ